MQLQQQKAGGILMIRKPIITVVGHVDAGKTRLLDAVRGSAIVEKEAGGITQHIGATEVPIEVIKKLSSDLMTQFGFNITIPGLLFIDTPGHEAFTNLRKRGGSIADLAVVVVDVMKGLQNQTHEAIEILKSYKTPFIVAVNKVDTIHGWVVKECPITSNLREQAEDVVKELDNKIYTVVGQLHEKGFQSERFDRITDFTKQIPIVPISAKQKIGVPELLMFLAGLSQKYLEKKLNIHAKGHGKGTILEVKDERGLGKTIDVILYDGVLKVGEEIVLGGREGVIKTKVRALLEPKPLEEMRNSIEKFKNVKEVHAAAGVKIAAPNLDNALAGSPLRVVEKGNEEALVLEEIKRVKIDSDAVGPIVKADALGSLEALTKMLEERGIKVKKADVGEVSRRDIIEIESVMEKDNLKGVVFAFHSNVSEIALKEAENKNIKIFQGDVIYKLLEEYEEWAMKEKNKDKIEKLKNLVLPAKIEFLKNNIFRNSRPAIVGVKILMGRLKANAELMKNGKVIGKVENIQEEGETIEEAREGQEVAISIDKAVVGRSIFEGDELYTYIPEKQLAKLEILAEVLSENELKLIDEIRKIREN